MNENARINQALQLLETQPHAWDLDDYLNELHTILSRETENGAEFTAPSSC